ncbi:hypothetical protein SALB_07272 [Streptomyces noursei]|uniref:ParB/Sulfiredoxin domain-containing protein n=1 Tax=Streptomyces noursei TaxID=1971 RepID=A0A401RA20_STRNR|nr:hypothetical protein SALB_07272 [Streptomyces noursei]
MLDRNGRVIDGRNRLKACEIAGVEPSYTTYEGDDPDGYALSANVHRRNLTKGQIAMITAKACSLSEQNGRSPKATKLGGDRVCQRLQVRCCGWL